LENDKPILVLGIETTCDETAAAVVERQGDGSGRILSNVVHSQTEEHVRFGGVRSRSLGPSDITLSTSISTRLPDVSGPAPVP